MAQRARHVGSKQISTCLDLLTVVIGTALTVAARTIRELLLTRGSPARHRTQDESSGYQKTDRRIISLVTDALEGRHWPRKISRKKRRLTAMAVEAVALAFEATDFESCTAILREFFRQHPSASTVKVALSTRDLKPL